MIQMKTRPKLVAALVTAITLLFAVPAVAQADWGAIAINPETGHYGISFEYNTAVAAQHRAKKECGGIHCKVAVWVRNGYAALVQKNNGVYFAGYGKTKSIAFANARKRAHEASAHSITSVFSGL
jgi:hypothetical protein